MDTRVKYLGRSGFPGRISHSPKTLPLKFIMSTKYWDLYVYYVKKCERENYINDIDPNHYEMEWNHFWPQCIFGDWPVGQYLTLKQHAIATALQTLVFKRNCMFRTHKNYLPPNLLALAWPYYCEASSVNGKKGSAKGNLVAHAEKDESGRSVTAVKAGAGAAAALSRKVIVTFPDGSHRLFSSVRETGRFLGFPAWTISNRIKKGPPRNKSKLFGYRFEFTTETEM